MPLIVLEGLDGSGKSTQLELLKKHAAGRGYASEYQHFPRLDTPLYGETIARFLRGDFGPADCVDPYTVALLFAGDRAAAKPMLEKWLAEKKWIFLDRYVHSNVAYQCAKVADENERSCLREWILSLEFDIYALPRPDVAIFLDVPGNFTARSLNNPRAGHDRDYLRGADDVHESSLDFQARVRQIYLAQPDLKVIDCADPQGFMLPPEDVFAKIVQLL